MPLSVRAVPAPPGDPLLDDLNPQQREAVIAPAGPVLILAGAGSGKTRVLTRRIGHLLRAGAPAHGILAITFTNKAAREMAGRVAELLGPVARGMWVQTFHAMCARILRREIAPFGYTPQFTVLDGDDQRTAVREVLRELDYNESMFPPQAVLGRISRAKNEMRDPAAERAAAQDPWSVRVATAYTRYQQKLQAANCLDFDDMIGLVVRLLEAPDEATDVAEDGLPYGGGARYRALFRHVLVDEYQDTNHAQYRLVHALVREHRSLTAVGDEDQSIYRFRGADRGNILRFEEDFPDALVIRLERNYRSTQAILDAAGSVITHNPRRYPKTLWTDRGAGEPIALYRANDPADEAAFVASEIAAAVPGRDGYGDFAVLYRTHAQSRAFEEALLYRGIPYVVVGGLKFYERKEIKDAFAYLRLLVNPLDRPAFARAVGAPRRGIGDATLAALDEHLTQTGESLASALKNASAIPGIARAAKRLEAFWGLLERLRGEAEGLVDAQGGPLDADKGHGPAEVAEIVASVLDRSGLLAELQADGDLEARARVENLQELVSVARQNGPAVGLGLAGLGRFLEQATLVADADNVPAEGDQDSPRGAVVLLTLHSAKGLEFPVVFLAGLEEGVFPHSRALEEPEDLEEERRLCYVGMTRARSRLFLSWASQRALYGGPPRPARPSRFLAEVDARLIAERRPGPAGGGAWRSAAPARRPGGGPAPAAAEGIVDVRAGERVVHPRWGEGLVRQVQGRGPDAEATIDFPDGGRRVVVLALARLQRPGGDTGF